MTGCTLPARIFGALSVPIEGGVDANGDIYTPNVLTVNTRQLRSNMFVDADAISTQRMLGLIWSDSRDFDRPPILSLTEPLKHPKFPEEDSVQQGDLWYNTNLLLYIFWRVVGSDCSSYCWF